MKANSFTCTDYRISGTALELDLTGVTADEAIAADWSDIKVTTDDGDLADAFAGYAPLSASVDAATKAVTLHLFADPDGLAKSLSAISKQQTDDGLTISMLSDAIAELSADVSDALSKAADSADASDASETKEA